MSRLAEYRRRRNFEATPEPAPARRAAGRRRQDRLGYVVQLHHARSRHYDFRLEFGGTLHSWAIPKGPSLDPGLKRLAVEVEDHPLDYADFEGDIPDGHYGAGHVDLWDRGEWRPDGDPAAALKKGHLGFELVGSRLHGHWDLVRTRYAGRQPQWLLVKRDDEHGKAGDVADDTPLRETRRPAKRAAARKPRRTSAREAPLPESIGLQLARLEARAPASADWLHELKYDGYRALLSRDGDTVRISSRNGLDWTAQLPALADALRGLPCGRCVLDSELVVFDGDGHSRFALLQERFSDKSETGIRAIVFDLLFLDGHDLRAKSQIERKHALADLLGEAAKPLQVSDYLEGHGPEMAQAACAAGLEGIVSKQRDAPYRAGREGAWLKIKCVDAGEFAVVGYTTGKGTRAKLGALLLAEPGGGAKKAWRYIGRVGSGFDDGRIDALLKTLKPRKTPPALANPPDRASLRGAKIVWVQAGTVVEVEHRGRTADGMLRQASLKGIRIDRSLRTLEQPDAVPRIAPAKASRRQRGHPKTGQAVTTTTAFTHPGRQLFDKPVITKQGLGDFYAKLAPRLLPELIRRPLSVIRCPDGATGACFFQKHASPGFSDAIRTVPITANDGGETTDYFYVEDLDGLLGLVQMSTIELHPWGSTIDDLERPDRLVFDLDPAEDVKWPRVIAAARRLRERLQSVKLESFVRTSGGKGLHVVVPLTPSADWETAKAFTQAIARDLAEEAPEEFIAVATKRQRKGRIFIDYLRNGRGATSVASYSVRAREGAPVAVPLRWEELSRLRSGHQYGYANLARRLARLGEDDPWDGIATLRQKLPRIPEKPRK